MTDEREPWYTYESVWDAIEDTPEAAAAMRMRSDLMIALRGAIARWNDPPPVVARRLGVTGPRLDDLLGGRIGRFTLDDLLALASRAGLDVRVSVVPLAA